MLTDRELEVLEKIAEGFKTKEISEQLFISVSTVESHRRNIIKKLGGKNIAHSISRAYKSKILKK